MTDEAHFEKMRQRMVELHLRGRDIASGPVLAAMERVPRHKFVPEKALASAYEDYPLPIGQGQTISQPYIVALMIQYAQIKPGQKVLEIGSGCGYAAAVMGEIAAEVYGVEIVPELASMAQENLKKVGCSNVHVVQGDGNLGLPGEAPFDAIIVSAAAGRIPQALRDQVKVGGRLVIPVGTDVQWIEIHQRISDDDWEVLQEDPVRFVPLVDG